mmetsp:Transcript_37587/g.103750  ORF Transcript_37587/g.103750 Transcript_37587/m.103750 type:complete len:205 (+) Transcript_37587:333-947(+)
MRTPARCHRSHTVECANLSVGSTVWLLRKTAQEARTGHALGRKDESRAALDAVRTRSACHQHNPVGTNDGAEGRGEEPALHNQKEECRCGDEIRHEFTQTTAMHVVCFAHSIVCNHRPVAELVVHPGEHAAPRMHVKFNIWEHVEREKHGVDKAAEAGSDRNAGHVANLVCAVGDAQAARCTPADDHQKSEGAKGALEGRNSEQ